MEPQTRFNLSAAIQNWREELSAQSNLTAETRRELETHVQDTVAELQRRGLNDEEAFWLARRRVGQPDEIGEEFGKADPARANREGVLWIAIAFLAMNLWQNAADGVWLLLFPPNIGMAPNWSSISQLSYPLLAYAPVAWLAVSLARGRSVMRFAAWRSLIRSRRRVIVGAGILVPAIKSFELAMELTVGSGFLLQRGWTNAFWTILLRPRVLIWPVMLVAIIVWLLPAEESRSLKRA